MTPGAARHAGPVRLGVSSCLLGNEVRFDGGHKRDRFVTDELGASDDVEIAVTVGDDAPPIAVIDAPDTAQVGENVRFDGSASTDDSAIST